MCSAKQEPRKTTCECGVRLRKGGGSCTGVNHCMGRSILRYAKVHQSKSRAKGSPIFFDKIGCGRPPFARVYTQNVSLRKSFNPSAVVRKLLEISVKVAEGFKNQTLHKCTWLLSLAQKFINTLLAALGIIQASLASVLACTKAQLRSAGAACIRTFAGYNSAD